MILDRIPFVRADLGLDNKNWDNNYYIEQFNDCKKSYRLGQVINIVSAGAIVGSLGLISNAPELGFFLSIAGCFGEYIGHIMLVPFYGRHFQYVEAKKRIKNLKKLSMNKTKEIEHNM